MSRSLTGAVTPRHLGAPQGALLCSLPWTPQTLLVGTASHTHTAQTPNSVQLHENGRSLASFSSGGRDPPAPRSRPGRQHPACSGCLGPEAERRGLVSVRGTAHDGAQRPCVRHWLPAETEEAADLPSCPERSDSQPEGVQRPGGRVRPRGLRAPGCAVQSLAPPEVKARAPAAGFWGAGRSRQLELCRRPRGQTVSRAGRTAQTPTH